MKSKNILLLLFLSTYLMYLFFIVYNLSSFQYLPSIYQVIWIIIYFFKRIIFNQFYKIDYQ